jgi:hypothetical protein
VCGYCVVVCVGGVWVECGWCVVVCVGVYGWCVGGVWVVYGSGGKSSMSVMTGGGEVREDGVATHVGGVNESVGVGVGVWVCCW